MNWWNIGQVQFDPPFPAGTIICFGGAIVLLALWREAKGGRRLAPRWLHAPAALARIGVVALLVLLLLNPIERSSERSPAGRSLILIDQSASMTLAAENDTTRWLAAKLWANELKQAALAAGLAEPDTRFFSAGETTAGGSVTAHGNETRMAEALQRLLAASASTPIDAIVIVSDGCAHDRADLPSALALAGASGTPLSTHTVGIDSPPRNAWIVSLQSPRIVRPDSVVTVYAEVATSGFSDGEILQLVLTDDRGKQLANQRVPVPAGADETMLHRSLTFQPGLRSARYTLDLQTAGRPEVAEDDNRVEFSVEIGTTRLRVLFVEGSHGKRMIGDAGHALNSMEFMTRAWENTGEIDYTCLTAVDPYSDHPNLVGVTFHNGEMKLDAAQQFPQTREEVYGYDVILISDIRLGNFSDDQLQWVTDWVLDRGGGFMMGGGVASFDVGNYDQTPWERIIPVDMLSFGEGLFDRPFEIEIPEGVQAHPLWAISDQGAEANLELLKTHPTFRGMNRVRRAKPGALVLAVRAGSDHEPAIATQRYGRGRSLAFLPDPNGWWGESYVTWGPPDAPAVGPHVGLGNGGNLKFDRAAAKAPAAPMPEFPAPYYGKFWVNVVRWLGQDSIRWRRDQLAGRSAAAQARPGHPLPVAAEVLAVHSLDKLLALDVGARLDLLGSSRVRLEYDRDRREFFGELAVPAGLESGEINLLFDTAANRLVLTGLVPVQVRAANLEYANSAPDHAFMGELASAGGGTVLATAAEAVAELRRATEAHARVALVQWDRPLWDRWPLWGIIVALLGIEWALRRHGATTALANERSAARLKEKDSTRTKPLWRSTEPSSAAN